jgi:hypothetical protein
MRSAYMDVLTASAWMPQRLDGFCSHFLFKEFIRNKSLPGEYEQFCLKNRGPSAGSHSLMELCPPWEAAKSAATQELPAGSQETKLLIQENCTEDFDEISVIYGVHRPKWNCIDGTFREIVVRLPRAKILSAA